MEQTFKLYESLAEWWPLLSAPADYAEESALYTRLLGEAGDAPASTLVEFGSGGGNNAYHLKQHFRLTLVEPSPGMRGVSRTLNPDCEHIDGDMRTVRLRRQFDRVFIHDAICYMTTLDDLRRAVRTAYEHCRPGGAALFVPDHVRENFEPSTTHGGSDHMDGRSLRYLEWTHSPDRGGSTYAVDYVVAMRTVSGELRIEHDHHVEGLFSRTEWLAVMVEVGFDAKAMPFELSDVEPGSAELFLAAKPRP